MTFKFETFYQLNGRLEMERKSHLITLSQLLRLDFHLDYFALKSLSPQQRQLSTVLLEFPKTGK